jgi:hypothetical protein
MQALFRLRQIDSHSAPGDLSFQLFCSLHWKIVPFWIDARGAALCARPRWLWPASFSVSVSRHRLAQDAIHRRGQNQPNINTGVRKQPAARGGPRSVLHLSASSILHKNPTQRLPRPAPKKSDVFQTNFLTYGTGSRSLNFIYFYILSYCLYG